MQLRQLETTNNKFWKYCQRSTICYPLSTRFRQRWSVFCRTPGTPVAARPLSVYQQYFIDFGYKELCIPGPNGVFMLDKMPTHLAPHHYMLIALPNMDGSLPVPPVLSFWRRSFICQPGYKGKVNDFFSTTLPMDSAWYHHWRRISSITPSSLVTVKMFSLGKEDHFTLISDRHTPLFLSLARGWTAVLKTAVWNSLIEKHDEDWNKNFTWIPPAAPQTWCGCHCRTGTE